jgi:phosphoglucomutase
LFDEETRKQVKYLMDHDEKELIESFYTNLEFGTGGLRGIMGVGINRMNIYTVALATQGFANYIIEQRPTPELKVAIAHDCRNNSVLFAQTVANVFSANGFKVYLFNSLRPTPELSYAVRYFGCSGGVVITASHNPKEYNGFKAYWSDGGQLTAPHDKNVVKKVTELTLEQVKFDACKEKIEILDEKFDEIFISEVLKQTLSPDSVKKFNDIKIVYSALHGTGAKLVPAALKKMGFTNLHTVAQQDIPDGNFPTIHSPNPEEKAALDMALNLAEEVQADLVMATDPDADRVGIAIRNSDGKLELMNGNQTASLLMYYVLRRWKENGLYNGNEYVIKTIVSSELLSDIAKSYNVEVFNVLTGFKFIADVILRNEGKKKYICGGEESYGFLVGDYVRDKDAINACVMIAECAAWAKSQNKSIYDILMDIYAEYGLYKESLISITKKGKEGIEEIGRMMAEYRQSPPTVINGYKVVSLFDYQLSVKKDIQTGAATPIDLPKSNVLQFLTEDGSLISVRPSGTEPKIKFYFGVKTPMTNKSEFAAANAKLDEKINNIIDSLKLR